MRSKKISVAEGDEQDYAAIDIQNPDSHRVLDENRTALITPEIENALFGYIHGIVQNNGSKLLAAGGTTNHIHLFVSLGKKTDLPELIGDIKRASSSWIKEQHASFSNFYWQKGYGAFSIGQSQAEIVVKHINNQKEHHQKNDFKDEFRELLKKYEIEYDEQYMWD